MKTRLGIIEYSFENSIRSTRKKKRKSCYEQVRSSFSSSSSFLFSSTSSSSLSSSTLLFCFILLFSLSLHSTTASSLGATFQRYISPNFTISDHNEKKPLLHTTTAPSDPYFEAPIVNQSTVVGRAATLECDVANLGPDNKVAWLKMDSTNSEPTVLTIGTQTLFGERKFRVTHNGRRQWFLHIRHVRHSDRGLYMCQVNAQRMISQIGQLDVQVPPIIIESQTSSDTTVEEHSRAVLRCGAKGVPKPKVTWRREDGRDINLGLFGGQKYAASTADGPELNLTQVTRDDMGAYLCIASNGVLPSLSKRILLHVNFRPKIRVHKQMISARVGVSIEIVCTCEASPRPLVTWMSPTGIPLATPGNSSLGIGSFSAASPVSSASYEVSEEYHGYRTTMRLRIHSMSVDDFGSFKCIAKNTLGEKEGLIRVYEDSKKSVVSIQKHGKTSGNLGARSLKSRKSARRDSSLGSQQSRSKTSGKSEHISTSHENRDNNNLEEHENGEEDDDETELLKEESFYDSSTLKISPTMLTVIIICGQHLLFGGYNLYRGHF